MVSAKGHTFLKRKGRCKKIFINVFQENRNRGVSMKGEEKAGSSDLYLAYYSFLKNKIQPTTNKAIKLQKSNK